MSTPTTINVYNNGVSTPAQDRRPLVVQKQEQVNLPANGTVPLLYVPPGNAGTVRMIQVALAAISPASDAAMNDSQIIVSAQGVVQSVPLGALFRTYGNPAAFTAGENLIVQNATTSNSGAYISVEIPFDNGISIVLSNASTSTALLFSQVSYQAGPRPITNRNVWQAVFTGTTSVTQYTNFTALPSVSGCVELETFYLLVKSAGGFQYLEGNPSVTIDGNVQVWGGTEDFFGGQYYWNYGATAFTNNKWGVKMGTQLIGYNATLPNSASMWRNFANTNEPVFSKTSLVIVWPNGQSGQGAPGTVTASSFVSYWLDKLAF